LAGASCDALLVIHAFLPSPSQGVWHLGPFPIRAYALAILTGVVVAVVITRRRLVAVGGRADQVDTVVAWAVPFGLVGARLYHVVTDPELYFGAGRYPVRALYVWEGGLGIWGGVAAGALGAWIGCRRHGLSLSVFADAAAPGVAIAQAIGRIGNYFNQELYGRPSTLPWALQIDPAHRPADTPNVATYQPTFLYEGLWNLGVAAVVIWAGRRYRLGAGRVFALYVALYTVGRGWVEYLRVDHANHLFGLRLNDWTSLVVFTVAAVYLAVTRHLSATTGEAVDGTTAVSSPLA
jgi:prolipoprotein diacylglyceryl transferase